MLTLFDTNVAIPFFPARWANSVTQWLTGLVSPSGTIKIQNTSNPDESGGCKIDVDVETLYKQLRARLEQDFVSKGSGLLNEMRNITGASIHVKGDRLEVDDAYLAEQSNLNNKEF